MTSRLLVLLPPSETKTDGGNSRISSTLSWPELEPVRHGVVTDLIHQATNSDPEAAAKALKISAKQAATELARNRNLANAPLKPAIERYTGVLFDAIDVQSLSDDQRWWMETHVAIHSAAYGLVYAGDCIPAYRCSYNSNVGGTALKRRWQSPISEALASHDGPIIDLRSKGYVGLGPLPAREQAVWMNVRERLPDGTLRSLNHFNKAAKGRFVRLLAERLAAHPEPQTLTEVFDLVADLFAVEIDATGQAMLIARA